MKLIPIVTQEVGKFFVLAGSNCAVQIYPAYLKIFLEGIEVKKVPLKIGDVPTKFSVSYDLCKRKIQVSLNTKKGFISYFLYVDAGSLIFFLEKDKNNLFSFLETNADLKKPICLLECVSFDSTSGGKLFLGSMKKKDAALVERELDLHTLLPWFFYLGKTLKQPEMYSVELTKIAEKEYSDKNSMISFFKKTLKGFFSGFFYPMRNFFSYLGFNDIFTNDIDIFSRISFFSELIQNIFLNESEGRLQFLPNLPREFPQGKIIDYENKDIILNFFWSRSRLRKVEIKAKRACKLDLELSNKQKITLDQFEC